MFVQHPEHLRNAPKFHHAHGFVRYVVANRLHVSEKSSEVLGFQICLCCFEIIHVRSDSPENGEDDDEHIKNVLLSAQVELPSLRKHRQRKFDNEEHDTRRFGESKSPLRRDVNEGEGVRTVLAPLDCVVSALTATVALSQQHECVDQNHDHGDLAENAAVLDNEGVGLVSQPPAALACPVLVPDLLVEVGRAVKRVLLDASGHHVGHEVCEVARASLLELNSARLCSLLCGFLFHDFGHLAERGATYGKQQIQCDEAENHRRQSEVQPCQPTLQCVRVLQSRGHHMHSIVSAEMDNHAEKGVAQIVKAADPGVFTIGEQHSWRACLVPKFLLSRRRVSGPDWFRRVLIKARVRVAKQPHTRYAFGARRRFLFSKPRRLGLRVLGLHLVRQLHLAQAV